MLRDSRLKKIALVFGGVFGMKKTPVNRFLSNLKNRTYPNRVWRSKWPHPPQLQRFSPLQDPIGASLQVNSRVRYSKLLNQNRDLFDESKSVLEVGSGVIGIAPYLKRKVVGLELNFSGLIDQWLEPVVGSIFAIPFADQSFDIVVCVDVLEHLPQPLRAKAISELMRCARSKVIISCPCGPAAEEGERHLVNMFRQTRICVPGWLNEHRENGLPSVGSIFDTLVKSGLPFEMTGNETMNQHFAGILLDTFFPFSQHLTAQQAAKAPFTAPVGEGEWDSYYSYLFTIHTAAQLGSKAPRALNETGLANEARLYCVYHKPWPTEHLGQVIPIYAGSAALTAPKNALTDRMRDGASLHNQRWSELSAYYKIWKEGPQSDIVGFSHYRRLFDFRKAGPRKRETVLSKEGLGQNIGSYFDLAFLEQARSNAIIVPPPIELKDTVWEQYGSSHNMNDYCAVLNIISQRFPELLALATDHFHSNKLYSNNMLVTSWAIFEDLCTCLFDVLLEFEKTVPPGRANPYQNRDISFLAERIFDLWLRHKRLTGTEIIECPIFFIKEH